MKTAVEATSAIVGAKIAEQKAINTMVAASQASQAVAKIDSAVSGAVSEAKEKVAEATQKFADLQAKNQRANEVLASQTTSEDAKAKAQDALRDARDAAALAARQAAEADAKAKQLAVEKAKAEQEQRAIEAAAEDARAEANRKKAMAMAKQADAIDTQRKVDDRMEQARKAIGMAPTEELMTALMSAKAGKGHKDLFPKELAEIAPLIQEELARRTPAPTMPTPANNNGSGAQVDPFVSTAPPPSAEATPQLIVAAPQMITTQPQSGSGISGTTIALGLGVVGLLVYAASRRKTSLNDAPLIAEIEEDEE
jgi:colicin import membrane protein